MTDAERLEKAIVLVVMLYRGKLDKARNPAVLHPLSVMDKFPPSELRLRTIAVLHDVCEDFTINTALLRDWLELDAREINAIGFLSKQTETYDQYIHFIGHCEYHEALLVKLADLEHNLSRASGIPDEQERNRLVQRWTEARTYLLERKEKFDAEQSARKT